MSINLNSALKERFDKLKGQWAKDSNRPVSSNEVVQRLLDINDKYAKVKDEIMRLQQVIERAVERPISISVGAPVISNIPPAPLNALPPPPGPMNMPSRKGLLTMGSKDGRKLGNQTVQQELMGEMHRLFKDGVKLKSAKEGLAEDFGEGIIKKETVITISDPQTLMELRAEMLIEIKKIREIIETVEVDEE